MTLVQDDWDEKWDAPLTQEQWNAASWLFRAATLPEPVEGAA